MIMRTTSLILSLLIASMVGGGCSRSAPTQVSFLAVGQGDATVFQSQGLAAMVDAGPRRRGDDAGSRVVVPELRRLGARTLDILILTHPDDDHIGGLPGVSRRVRIGKIVISEAFRSHPILTERLREAGIRNEQMMWVRDQARFRVGEWSFEVLAPRIAPGHGDNHGSLFIRAQAGRFGVVMTGDATEEVERQMGPRLKGWQATVLKAGHHGAEDSTSNFLLKLVRPQLVVVSSGSGNPFGHPSPGVLNRAGSVGARVWRTDRQGTLTLPAR